MRLYAFVDDCLLRGAYSLGQILLLPGWSQSSIKARLSIKTPPGAALPAAASRGTSSSPHPSDAILDTRLRLRVTIRTPEFMPEAVNYASPWPRGPATCSTRMRNYNSQGAQCSPRPRKYRLVFRQLPWAGGVRPSLAAGGPARGRRARGE